MPKKKSAPAAMLDLTIGHWIARLTYVAAKLIPDRLLPRARGPYTGISSFSPSGHLACDNR